MTNAGSKLVNEVGEIPGSGQTKTLTDMIANVMSLNEITKKYLVLFDSGHKNSFKVHIGDKIVNFPANNNGIHISKPDMILSGEVSGENKMNMT